MANTLRFKRGLVSTIPTALAGEPLFTTDTFDLYIGNGTTNTRFQKYIASGTTSQLLRGDGSLLTMPIVLTSPSTGQVLKYNGTSWVNDSDAGITGSGTTNYLPKFTGASTLGNSLIWDNGTNVGIGTTSASFRLDIRSTTATIASVSGGSLTNQGSAYYVHKSNVASGSLTAYGDEAAITGGTPDLAAMIFTSASIPLKFYLNGALRMTLNDSGRLLLGSATDNGLRFQVTGDGYFSGSVGIGSTSLTGYGVRNSRNITGALACYGFSVDGTIQSDATSSINIFNSVPATQAASFNIGSLIHFIANQGTQGAGSTISNQYGFLAQAGLTGATNNYGFYGNIASGTGRWNLYMSGTAANYLNGELLLGSTLSTGEKLQVTGTAKITGLTSFGTTVTFNGSTIYNSGAVIRSDNGTAAAPSISFDSDLDTGIYRIAANTLGFSTLGTERMRLDASGNLGLGTTSPSTTGAYGTPKISVESNIYASAQIMSHNDTSGNYSFLGIGKSRGTGASPTAVASGEVTGSFLYYGHTGSAYQPMAYINCSVADTPSASSMPGFLTFGTTPTSSTNPVERMRIFADGNIGINSGSTNTGERLQVNGTMRVSGAAGANNLMTFTNGTNTDYLYLDNSGFGLFTGASATGSGIYYRASNIIDHYISGSIAMRLTSTSNLLVGTTTDAGFKLDVNGTMRVSGASTITNSTLPSLKINHTATGHASAWFDTNEFGLLISSASTSASHYLVNMTSNSISRFRVGCDGAATFSSTAQAAGFITSGGAGYAVINSASNTVTALRPTGGGASIMSTNSNGLHIAVGTQAAGDLILASNNTERIRLSSNGFFSQLNATNPSASITDSYIQYSADVIAGNAAPHFRTENGAIIKLYQETTGVGNSIISLGGGNAVLDDTTFDGYTLRQIVKALRNQGILA